MDFRKYIRNKIKKDNKIIEFGPLNRPLFTKKEFKNIYYADIRSTEEVKQLYSGNDYMKKTGITIDTDTIVDIDYKINGTYKNTFKEQKFDVAYLSHVIEHIPDIINFFDEISEVLKKDGLLAIIYPDKRYCFDHFRNEASFRDAYATHKYGLKENARMAFDFAYNVVHENNPYRFWSDENIVEVISKANISEGKKYYNEILKGNIIEDVHFWPFSDYGFLKFIYEMQRAELMNFDILEFKPTEENTQEFLIILKKVDKPNIKNTLKYLKQYDEFLNIIKVLEKNNVKIEKLTEELEDKTKENEKLIENIKAKDIINQQLKEEINNLYNSKSMKITKPLRVIMSKIKK